MVRKRRPVPPPEGQKGGARRFPLPYRQPENGGPRIRPTSRQPWRRQQQRGLLRPPAPGQGSSLTVTAQGGRPPGPSVSTQRLGENTQRQAFWLAPAPSAFSAQTRQWRNGGGLGAKSYCPRRIQRRDRAGFAPVFPTGREAATAPGPDAPLCGYSLGSSVADSPANCKAPDSGKKASKRPANVL